MKTLYVALGLALAANSSARASFYDGNAMYDLCLSDRILAHMYVMGVLEGIEFYSDSASGAGLICLPKNAVARQISDVSCNYLRDHPEKRQYSAASIVTPALMEAFPCK